MKLALIALLAGVTNHAIAGLPDSKTDISKLVSKLDGREGIGEIIGDRDSSNVVYVRPTSKSFIGDFAQVGGAVSCHELHENRITTFRYPSETEIQRVLESSQAYSPAFESTFGVFARNSKITNDIQKLRSEITTYTREHKEIYGRYQKAKSILEGKQTSLKSLELRDRNLDTKLTSQLALSSTEEERQQIISEYRENKTDLSHELVFISDEVQVAHANYKK
jgi:hypothetical protein